MLQFRSQKTDRKNPIDSSVEPETRARPSASDGTWNLFPAPASIISNVPWSQDLA